MNTNKRLTNWDLLRALSMFLVVVVHIAPQLGSFHGINAGAIVSTGAIICDPIFFCLSGYFALRPLKKSYKDYLFGKALSLLLPIFVYAGLLYVYKATTGSVTDTNFIRYTSGLIQGGWWFVPALIPFILVAPVLSKMFDALDDRTCKIALFVTLGIYAWGGLSSAANSLLINSQHVTFAAAISMLQRIIPRSLLGGTYFTFFCMGYFIKRVTPLLDTRETHFIMASGALFFIIDIASAYYGLDRSDPSFNWMIVTVAIFITFDGIKHQSQSLSKLIEWAAKRSYSIYLLQYATIEFAIDVIYIGALHSGYATLAWPLRLITWVSATVLAYGTALIIASIVDTFVIEPIQTKLKQCRLKIAGWINSTANGFLYQFA